MADSRPFVVIDGTPAPATPKERARATRRKSVPPDLEHVLRCHRCTGISFLEVRLGMTWRNGKPAGGQKQLICETCHRAGERVVIGI